MSIIFLKFNEQINNKLTSLANFYFLTTHIIYFEQKKNIFYFKDALFLLEPYSLFLI